MSEEIRRLKKVIAGLEEENTQLQQYKDQVANLRITLNFLERENSKFKKELDFAKSEIAEMDINRKVEMEKLKSSFDEMDELLLKEKDNHRMEEEKLLNIISQLEMNLRLSEEKEQSLKLASEKINRLKKDKEKLQEKIAEYKQNETIYNRLKLELKARNDELANEVENLTIENTKLKNILEHEKDEVLFISNFRTLC
eukprot:TRINITY_DN7160_c0_g2_i1.p1 TRINITY_DN7160_c0_g2~~TRINITY_DN7160_c0_g2_i1.p1  ORF type:complete len:198 (-),score=56.08 TRINITY_DN7160_c0_g2_i1:255-848(-)